MASFLYCFVNLALIGLVCWQPESFRPPESVDISEIGKAESPIVPKT